MNIVLIGYRGTGKTQVGLLLSKTLDMKLVSMDEEIVKTAGMGIPEIVERFGWTDFRDRETAQARELAGCDGLVVDCGGGVIERQENVAILRQNARVFWLRASVAAIVERIQEDTERPALVEGKTFTQEVAEVLQRRTPKYRGAAHHEIDTDGMMPQQVAEQVVVLWNEAVSG